MSELRLDIAVRWEGDGSPPTDNEMVSRRQSGGGWVAYNVGAKPPHAEQCWSTHLGPATIEEIGDLFRNCNILFLPPASGSAHKTEDNIPLDFTPVN